MPGFSQADMRTVNRFSILDQIRRNGPVSRVELAELTGLSRALVTRVTAELIGDGLVIERPTAPTKNLGRRRINLDLNDNAAYSAGVKISMNQVSFAVVNFRARVLSSLSIDAALGKQPMERWVEVIHQGVESCAARAGLAMTDLSGLGVGLPGFVDWQTGHVHWTPLTNAPAPDLGRMLQARFPFPVYLENDVNSVTQGEQWFGRGRGLDNFIVVSVEEGLGMGIVIQGRIYRGARGIGAEFGHMVLDPDGPRCTCGKKGCVEAYAGGRGIMAAAEEARRRGAWPNKPLPPMSVDELIDLAHSGDLAATTIFNQAGRMLGLGVAGLIQVFNPSRVIVTGEYARAGKVLFGPMTKAMAANLNKEFLIPDMIIFEQWKDADWAHGAACLALQSIYRTPQANAAPAADNGNIQAGAC